MGFCVEPIITSWGKANYAAQGKARGQRIPSVIYTNVGDEYILNVSHVG